MNYSPLKFSKLRKGDYFVLMFINVSLSLPEKSHAVNPVFSVVCINRLPVSEVITAESYDIADPACLLRCLPVSAQIS